MLKDARTKKKTKPLPSVWTDLSDDPCPRCLELAVDGAIRAETVQRLLRHKPARPLARDGSGECCGDCASADTLMRWPGGMTFAMARIAVGNDRQDQYRIPGAPMGTVSMGITRPSRPGDLEDQHAWLDKNDWFGTNCDAEGACP